MLANAMNKQITWIVIMMCTICAFGEDMVDRGSVTGKTYVNSFFGLSFTIPPNLAFASRDQEIPRGSNTFVLIKARGIELPGQVTTLILLSVDKLQTHSEGRKTAKARLDRAVKDQIEDGYVFVQRKEESFANGLRLQRADLQKGPLYEAVLVTTRREYAVFLIVTASSEKELESVIRSTQLSFKN